MQDDTDHVAGAADFLDEVRAEGDELTERGVPDDGALGDLGDELFGLEDLEHGQTGGGREGTAAESGTVRTRQEEVVVRRGHPDRADGETAAEALGHGDRVGLHARMLVSEELTGATDAALDLVDHEQDITLAAELLDAAEELRGGGIDAAFSLDRFDQDGGGGLGVDGLVPGREVVERDCGEAGQQRTEALLDLLLRRGGHAAEGAAMEGLLGDDDADAGAFRTGLTLAMETGELEQAFVGLGAAVAEDHAA